MGWRAIKVRDETFQYLETLKVDLGLPTYDEVIRHLINTYYRYKSLVKISKVQELIETWSKLQKLLRDPDVREFLNRISGSNMNT